MLQFPLYHFIYLISLTKPFCVYVVTGDGPAEPPDCEFKPEEEK